MCEDAHKNNHDVMGQGADRKQAFLITTALAATLSGFSTFSLSHLCVDIVLFSDDWSSKIRPNAMYSNFLIEKKFSTLLRGIFVYYAFN